MSEIAPVIPLFGQRPGLENVSPEASSNGLPDIDIDWVETTEHSKIHYFDGGKMLDRTHVLPDGSQYKSREIVPAKQLCNVGVSKRTPWCTDIDGFNTEVGKEFARAGITTFIVGPENSGLLRAARKCIKTVTGDTTLMAYDAKVNHAILDAVEEDTHFESGLIIDDEYSRGAMTGLAFQGYAGEHQRTVVYSEFTDPCVEHSITRDEVELRKLAKYFMVEEPRELIRTMLKRSLEEMPNMAKTLRVSPSFWVNQIATGVAIFDGEAGTFVNSVPVDSRTYVKLFTGSNLNHAASWQHRLRNRPNVVVDTFEGCHMTGTDPDVVTESVQRIKLVQEQVADGSLQFKNLNIPAIIRATSRRPSLTLLT